MPTPATCTPSCCDSINTVNVPGTAGQDAFTTTAANLTIVASPTTTNLPVGNSDWLGVGQVVFISDGSDYGHFQVTGIPDSTHITVLWLDYLPDSAVASVIGSGATVTASGPQGSTFTTTELRALNATLLTGIAAFTDNTGGTASDTLAAGVGISYWSFYAKLSDVTAADSVGAFTPGHAFKILSLTWLGLQAGTGAGATITFTPKIAGSAITGGVLVPTLANSTAGSVVAASTITAANTGTAAQTFSITASAITPFTNGTGTILVKVQNMDSVNAFASLAEKINDINAALRT